MSLSKESYNRHVNFFFYIRQAKVPGVRLGLSSAKKNIAVLVATTEVVTLVLVLFVVTTASFVLDMSAVSEIPVSSEACFCPIMSLTPAQHYVNVRNAQLYNAKASIQ